MLKKLRNQRSKGFTITELLVGITTGTLIIGAASMGLRSTQTLINESHNKATLRQNTTTGVRLMRSEIERSMNVLVVRTEGVQEGEEHTDLTNHQDIVSLCQDYRKQRIQAILGSTWWNWMTQSFMA